MAHRALEVLIVALLVIATAGVVFQFQTHQLLGDILAEMRADRERAFAAPSYRADYVHPPERPDSASSPAANQFSTPAPSAADRPEVIASDPSNASEARAAGDRPADPDESQPRRSTASASRTAERQPPLAEPTLNVGGLGAAVHPLEITSAPATRAPEPRTSDVRTAAEQQAPTTDPAPAGGEPRRETAAGTDEPSREWEEHGEVVLEVIDQLLGGEYEQVVQRFNSAMANNLTPAQLAAAVDPERSRHGGFERMVSHRTTTDGLEHGLMMFHVDAELTSGHQLSFTVTLDERQRVCGLLMK